MVARMLDRLGFALWLAGFVLLVVGFVLRMALGTLWPARRAAAETADDNRTAEGRWAATAQS